MTSDLMMVGSYDYRLVALSVLVSILAAYAACDLSERLRDTRGRARLAWQMGGPTAHGIGTWSMHYTGMLAFRTERKRAEELRQTFSQRLLETQEVEWRHVRGGGP
jgi:NO-binding membrane sensor protein with MHYT domain